LEKLTYLVSFFLQSGNYFNGAHVIPT
jgi:hypothetical protein